MVTLKETKAAAGRKKILIGVCDEFGQTGKPDQLLEAYHLKDVDIAQAARTVIKRKTDNTQACEAK